MKISGGVRVNQGGRERFLDFSSYVWVQTMNDGFGLVFIASCTLLPKSRLCDFLQIVIES